MAEIKVLRCPQCGRGRVLDAAEHTNPSMLRLYPPEKRNQADWFVKCPICKQQIGFVLRRN